MKHILPFNERKNVGILYHYTRNLKNVNKILRFNRLKPMSYSYISFTRNQSFVFYDMKIRFVMDGTALSDAYEIKPFQFNPTFGLKSTANTFNDEFEERIVFPHRYDYDNSCCITDFKKYLIRVEVLDTPPEDEDDENRQKEVAVLRERYPDVEFVLVKKFGR